MLCMTYVHTSQDPIKGNDQRSGMLWSNIKLAFVELSEKEGSESDGMGREILALYNRFKCHISKDVQLYCVYLLCVQSNNKSGVSVEEEALQMYLSLNGKSFRFLACVNILKQMPKYCFDNGESVQDDKDSSDDMSSLDLNVGVYSAMNVDRPIGNKRAKKEWICNNTVGDSDQQLVVLETLENATNAISKTMSLKENKEHLLSMDKFYQVIKDKKEILGYLCKLKYLENGDDQQMVTVTGLGNVSQTNVLGSVGASIDVEAEVTRIKKN